MLDFDLLRQVNFHLKHAFIFLDFPAGANGFALIVTLRCRWEVVAIIPPDENDETLWRGVILTDIEKGGLAAGTLDEITQSQKYDKAGNLKEQTDAEGNLTVALEAQRDAAYFESPDARVRSGRLQLLNADFMSATTGIHMLHQTGISSAPMWRRKRQTTSISSSRPGSPSLIFSIGGRPSMTAISRPILS